MAPPKGSRNAREYQRKTMEATFEKVSSALQTIKRCGILFHNVSSLSRQISKEVGLSSASLRRNVQYRAALEGFLVSQRGAANLLGRQQDDVAVLRSKIKLLQLEITNKSHRIRVLEAAVSKAGIAERGLVDATSVVKRGLGSRTSDFVQTANLVLALVQWGNLTIKPETMEIVDDYAPTGKDTVVGSNLTRPFFQWLADQEGTE